MTSRHLVDPEILPLVDMPSFDFDAAPLSDHRLTFIEMMTRASMANTAPQVAVDERWVPGQRGEPDVRILVYTPQGVGDRPVAGILHIHGGGYVIGTADAFRAGCEQLVVELGCVVVSVDYRLAPETPHPGPVEDCYAALVWLSDNAGNLGVDRGRIGVSGESAGGGLAAALALLARDRGAVPLAFQHLIYPMIDDRTAATDDPHPFTGEFMWTSASNRFGWQALLGETSIGGSDVSPYAAAARATDLTGLPPTFISVGALDLFLDENLDYALRLSRAGVPVELHVYAGAVHGFQMIIAARVTMDANRDSLDALRRFTARQIAR